MPASLRGAVTRVRFRARARNPGATQRAHCPQPEPSEVPASASASVPGPDAMVAAEAVTGAVTEAASVAVAAAVAVAASASGSPRGSAPGHLRVVHEGRGEVGAGPDVNRPRGRPSALTRVRRRPRALSILLLHRLSNGLPRRSRGRSRVTATDPEAVSATASVAAAVTANLIKYNSLCAVGIRILARRTHL